MIDPGQQASPTVISIGECMVELSRATDGRFTLAYGGDTFNTAVYLARCGVSVAYATALGDDPYSAGIVELAEAEGIDTSLIERITGRNAGLYMIETTAAGERTFWYWRDRAPAREVFSLPVAERIGAAMCAAHCVYLSGISLSLYDATGLDRLESFLITARQRGVMVAVDGNYRVRGWGGDLARARSVFERFWRIADIALPTFDDEMALWSDTAPQQALDRLQRFGVREVALKLGPDGALISASGERFEVACPERLLAVDTTAAGDSFNAGYLARRLAGDRPSDAAVTGHRLAGVVIQHRGAIVPRAATSRVTAREG